MPVLILKGQTHRFGQGDVQVEGVGSGGVYVNCTGLVGHATISKADGGNERPRVCRGLAVWDQGIRPVNWIEPQKQMAGASATLDASEGPRLTTIIGAIPVEAQSA